MLRKSSVSSGVMYQQEMVGEDNENLETFILP